MAAITTLVAPSGECYEVKVLWVCSVITVWSTPECFRGELLTVGRYTNPATSFLYLYLFTYRLFYQTFTICLLMCRSPSSICKTTQETNSHSMSTMYSGYQWRTNHLHTFHGFLFHLLLRFGWQVNVYRSWCRSATGTGSTITAR